MFSLCCSQKRQDNFALSELRYRVSDKLGPAVCKQKINTFKLLKVMHKYLIAIHAGSSLERLRVQIPLVYTFHVLFASFSVKKPFTERQCLCFSFQYQKKSVRIKWNVMTKVHQQCNQTSKQEKQQASIVIVLLWNKHLVIFKHEGALYKEVLTCHKKRNIFI